MKTAGAGTILWIRRLVAGWTTIWMQVFARQKIPRHIPTPYKKEGLEAPFET